MPRYTFKDLAEVADEIEARAKAEDRWLESARKASDKDRAQHRGDAFREMAAMLRNATIG